MKNKFQNKKLKKTALSQIFLLVISIVAVGYILGSEVGVVSGIKQIGTISGGSEGPSQVFNKVAGKNLITNKETLGEYSKYIYIDPPKGARTVGVISIA